MLKGLDSVLIQLIFVEQLLSAWHCAGECGVGI